jgi:NAD(P)-dependent dehydrogenase (short-subunit alcohol dehydrogenase family)
METVVITGANRGIGLALCKTFLDAGWQVFAGCRQPAAASELQALSSQALHVLPVDVRDLGSVQAFAASLGGQCVDVLINNAGVMGGEHQGLEDMDYDAWLQTLDINVLGPHRVTRALLPNLRLSRHARILTVSSQMGAFGLDMDHNPYAYCSSKTGASRVMQIMAKDLRAEGIIACPVHPGWVQTDMGGPNAAITPQDSARGLFRLVTTMDLSHSGRFWTWEGKEHVW